MTEGGFSFGLGGAAECYRDAVRAGRGDFGGGTDGGHYDAGRDIVDASCEGDGLGVVSWRRACVRRGRGDWEGTRKRREKTKFP